MHRPRRRGIAAVCLTAPLLLAGCGDSGPKRVEVSGVVTWKGAPVKSGTVTFLPPSGTGGAAGGASIQDGQFRVPESVGLTPGEYKVAVNYPDPKLPPPNPNDPPGKPVEPREMLPATFNSNTTLRAEVAADRPNELTYDLK